ncbi:MAG: DUF4031 domain-containing protein [Mesorhizobium sp.]|uniref:DUF4031 domain-containing protein n=1 Tax=unclassified Mesorhizobium TaxID=325217 RepID=UPI000FC9D6D4|nr:MULTISPECIES: DUF4031 domain-containing protein [unclassified Mesorhizobium]RUV69674.1 DUF4031 domain-containing protein [Mesorhizobium sp. M5C.F.Cr.IN.023.01.1.1]RWI51096.1 MAG: DUF4031 domain-containing protein [Mesorhizobium sp.]RWI62082.1 MAG: DUF4031 domain-containing protein [Mesorhizobium sp.]RWJ13933.1 MAG: DUF4031 domain-containing protein [Mesorhizobium sp.]RWJ16842.1 MAG: DUF4031 domain-containing protein [Mesorhizobium sp.]
MAIYVDNMRAAFGRMKMCHMIADSTGELLSMADRIGVDRKWLQKAGTPHEHFDIALSKRALALSAGAVEVSRMELGRIIRRRREPRRCETNFVGGMGECLACDADQGETCRGEHD